MDSSHIQNPNDQREMKAFKLANDLEVLLIHEPSLNKSSASMDVAVGSLDDPEEHLGLAHFLEHMLFLGTEKYPSVDEYSEFLATHQGYSNAYTASEDTNYLFEVNHDGFEGALDRFAQFFISPTFDAQFTERERNAVHSEHQKNIENDDWREMMLRRSLHREGHPRRKFSTGDLKTLGNVDRKVLVDFYNRYYSANQMKLALMSKHSLADMEQWVRAKFVAVKNQQAVKPQYPQDPFAAAQLPLLVEIKPVKDLKKLNVMYALPSQEKDWQHKSLDLISTVLGFEGEGSILSYLKAQNLATGLGVGTDDASYSTSLYLEVQLTDKGLQHWQQVAETIHAYIAHMREQGFPEYVFTERQRMAEINFTFREFREGAYVTSQYARQMHRVPALEIDRANELYYRFDRTQIQALLAELVPENAMYFLSHKSAATDLTERYYGTPYRTEKLAQPLVNQWRQAKLPHGLTLPKPNPFIPEKLELLTAKNATQPQKIIDQDQVVYWFQQDDRFKVPKAYAQIHLLTPVVNSSAANKALSLLYSLALAEALNEWNYTAMLAGLHFSVGRDDRGLVIDLFGYAEKMPDFLRELTKRLRDVDLDPDHFRALKTQFKRDLANANLENAYQVGMYEMSFLVDKNKIHRDEIYAPEKQVDLITAVDIRDVKSFARNELYKMFRVEAAVYGSMQPESLGSVIAALPQLLDAQPLSVKLVPENEYVFPAEGQHAARALEGFTPNHCWAEQILLGEKNPSLSAALLVGHALLKTSFFSELRTKQQLGYVVHSSPRPTEKTVSMLFLIQSSEYAPGVLAGRVQEWKKQAIGQLKATPEELLAQVKKATATELREQEKTMAEKHQSLVYETLSMKGHLGYQEEVAVQVEELTLAQVIALYEKMFQPQTSRSVSVYLGKKGYNTTQTDQALHWVEDAVKYKSQQPTL
ncbi:MAG: insulinase family protein [Zetaproteobacteria bacterium]|nr:insulinase family protein [Zetaproteobacteria bacterium]